MAISADTLAGANVNDARAAYKVWIREVTRQFPSSLAQMVPEIFLPSEEMIRGVRQGTIECFGVTALEFVKIADIVDPDIPPAAGLSGRRDGIRSACAQ